MRQLTFKGFLYQYIRVLSQRNTNSIRLLAEEVLSNYRLVEPLVLYAMSVNKRDCLQRIAKDSHLVSAFQRFSHIADWNDIVALLESRDESIPNEFHKIYRSYLSERGKQKATNHTKSLVLNRIRKLQQEKKVSTYRLYTDLNLNHGNVHAYIKNGDVSKVSLDVADRILSYLEAA